MPAFQVLIVNTAGIDPNEVTAFVPVAYQWLARVQQYWPEVAGTTFQIVPAIPDDQAPNQALLEIAPNTTLANSVGYHNEASWDGPPIGIVEMDACQLYGVPWTVAATHEIGEMLINPKLDQFIPFNGLSYPKEIGDPVTGDQFPIDNIAVSNVVTPAWFVPNAPAGSVFDVMGLVTAPIPTIPTNGWLEWKDAAGNWSSQYGPNMAPAMVTYMNSRQGRRFTLRGGQPTVVAAAPGA